MAAAHAAAQARPGVALPSISARLPKKTAAAVPTAKLTPHAARNLPRRLQGWRCGGNRLRFHGAPDAERPLDGSLRVPT
jgi:hypothetical protein